MKPSNGFESNMKQIFVPHKYDGDTHEVDTNLGGNIKLMPISFTKLL